jgi:two-component system osmolarity sensor histidine kinase EnvZ
MRLPNTLLVRAFGLIFLLLLLALASTFGVFRHAQAAPRAQQIAQLVVSVVNLTRAALLSAAPEWRNALLAELAGAEGLQVQMADPHDVLLPLPTHPPELQMMSEKVRERLGAYTRFASERNGVPALWVSFFIGTEEFWVAVPREHIAPPVSSILWMWGGVVMVLALFGAYFIARQVARPLKHLAAAAQQIGKGTMPTPLPEHGAQEIVTVSRAFNQMTADLAAHERERALVLAGISHDLRTPLARVRLAAELSPDPSLRDGLIDDVQQMDAVIQQFLDYARLDASEPPVLTDVSDLIQTVAHTFRADAVALQLDLAPLPAVVVRPLLLKRALSNLLDNAIKYGGGDIKICLAQQGQHWVLSVADHGCGIPPDQRDTAVRPFTRLQTARSNTTGSGLGLAIVERTVQLHGGVFTLTENLGGGLRVSLSLPMASALP